MSDADRPQAEVQDPAQPMPLSSAWQMPDWAAASLIGLIAATGFSALIAQLKPSEMTRPVAVKTVPLVSIAEAARAKSSLQQQG
jgi:hypothetical protein